MFASYPGTLLNPDQEKAVQHGEGPLLVLAGAGSGKTRVVTHRIARLLDRGVPPDSILAVTFTNRAAEEMRERIQAHKKAQVLACTFHSLGARMLRESIHQLGFKNDFIIYDEADSEKLLKQCLEQLQLTGEKALFQNLRHQISAAKNDLVKAEEVHHDPLLFQTYSLYQKKLQEANAVDFDDLLFLAVRLLQENGEARNSYQDRWQFLLIDEYQDTNFAQYTLAKILAEKHRNLFAVGDPDQSIYSWRGARYQNILNFEADFPGAKIIPLNQNYRSTQCILNVANALISHNEKRYHKHLWSHLGEGSKVVLFTGHNEKQEATFVAGRIGRHIREGTPADEIAIFYRTNAQSRAFEDLLLSQRIHYAILGGISFYERKEVKDILALLRMVVSNSDLISFLRTLNMPRRGFGAATLDKLVRTASEKAYPILTFCEELLERPEICPSLKLGAKQKEGLRSYLKMIHELRHRQPHLQIHELIQEAIAASNYLSLLAEDPETAQDRQENLDELLAKAADWEEEEEDPSLPRFLEELSLRSHVVGNENLPSVKMMTLHHSKGLEFDTVFLVGLEEDLLPHVNAKENPSSLEEERRLCYVGITRAKKRLYLTSATYRYMWGTARLMRPSRFLAEIPKEYTQTTSKAV